MKENGIKLKAFEEILKNSFIQEGHVRSDLLPNYLPLPCPAQDELSIISSDLVNRLSIINKTIDDDHIDRSDIVNIDCSLKNITLHNIKDIRIEIQNKYVPWPFNLLPKFVGIRSHSQDSTVVSSIHRALRKELQIQSMLRCILPLLPIEFLGMEKPITKGESLSEKRFCIVDFAGGTGTLAIVLALLLPLCDIIIVDLKASSLHMVHEKTQAFDPTRRQDIDLHPQVDESIFLMNKRKKKARPPDPLRSKTNTFRIEEHIHQLHRCQYISNLYTYYGSIEFFSTDTQRPTFHLGICLHGCGEASDLVLRACGENGASFVVCPCCVGKLNRQKSNPYIFHATAADIPTVSYPQSQVFRNLLTSEEFDILAGAGDYSDYNDMHTCKYATRRTAKGIIEMDRILFMKERYGYDYLVMTKMQPFEASPKNDIVMGWRSCSAVRDPYECLGGLESISPCGHANADVQMTFYGRGIGYQVHTQLFNSSEWTESEENEIRSVLNSFLDSNELALTFPSGMGSRLRKLVHYLSNELGFKHWSKVSNKGEIVVIVEKVTKNVV